MSYEENLAAVQSWLVALEAGDRDSLKRIVKEQTHPEAEWSPLVTAVEGQAYRGHEGALTFFSDFLESFSVHYANLEYRCVGDADVLLLCQMELHGRGSGVDVSQETGVLFEFEGGLVRRGRVFPSHAQAVAVAEEVAR